MAGEPKKQVYILGITVNCEEWRGNGPLDDQDPIYERRHLFSIAPEDFDDHEDYANLQKLLYKVLKKKAIQAEKDRNNQK